MLKTFGCLSFFIAMFLISCSSNENYEKAYGYEKDGKTFIKLRGKRELMAHNPVSLISNGNYEVSLIIQVPSLQNGDINGRDIPVERGHYKYVGDVIIQDYKIQVKLSYDNTDDKIIDPISWNGKYILVRN